MLSDLIAGQMRDWRVLSPADERTDVSAIDTQSLLYVASLLQFGDEHRPTSRLETLAAAGDRQDAFLMPYDRSRYERMMAFARSRRGA